MKHKLLFVAIGLLLSSCWGDMVIEQNTVKTVEYEIVSINPPKHFYLDLKRVSDGKMFYHFNISKHCNKHRSIAIGRKIWIKEWSWHWSKTPNDHYHKYDKRAVYDCLCR